MLVAPRLGIGGESADCASLSAMVGPGLSVKLVSVGPSRLNLECRPSALKTKPSGTACQVCRLMDADIAD
ncbi:MAG: hypothetical protein U5L06_06195 [Rhodovibrio sp.]|nr:hypothetical protein [Rhodovibrio sp.]